MDTSSSGELDTQPGAGRTPPGSPPASPAGYPPGLPATAVAVEDRPPARRSWGLLDALPIILFWIALSILSLMSPADAAPPKVDVPSLLAAQSLFYLAMLGYIYWVISLRHKLPFAASLKWVMPERPGVWLLYGLGMAGLVQVLSIPVTKKLPIERLFESRDAAILLSAFGILVAPLVEEIVFRGFIFGAIERAGGLRAAVWSTSLLFATIHVPQLRGGGPQILVILIVGLMLSWVRGRTGSLAPPYLMHLSYNTTLFTMMYFATQGFRRFEH